MKRAAAHRSAARRRRARRSASLHIRALKWLLCTSNVVTRGCGSPPAAWNAGFRRVSMTVSNSCFEFQTSTTQRPSFVTPATWLTMPFGQLVLPFLSPSSFITPSYFFSSIPGNCRIKHTDMTSPFDRVVVSWAFVAPPPIGPEPYRALRRHYGADASSECHVQFGARRAWKHLRFPWLNEHARQASVWPARARIDRPAASAARASRRARRGAAAPGGGGGRCGGSDWAGSRRAARPGAATARAPDARTRGVRRLPRRTRRSAPIPRC